MNWKTVQWDVVWSIMRTLLVAGGPVSAVLIALGFPPVTVSMWTAVGLAAVGVLAVAVPGLIGAFSAEPQVELLAKNRFTRPREYIIKSGEIHVGAAHNYNQGLFRHHFASASSARGLYKKFLKNQQLSLIG